MEDMALMQKRLKENSLSLNIDKRRAEIDEEKARKESRKKTRDQAKPIDEKRYVITLDSVSNPKLLTFEEKEKQDNETRKERAKSDEEEETDEEEQTQTKVVDAVRMETLNILGDLIALGQGPKTAATTPAK
jgi:hypothetical protein